MMADHAIADTAPAPPTKKAGLRRPNRKSATTRARILCAAADICAERGYGATKLVDIAVLAEMHLSALYYYFDTKEALFMALIGERAEQACVELIQVLEGLPRDTPARVRLEIAMRTHLASILKPGSLGRAYFQIVQQAPAEIRSYTVDATRRENRIFRELVEDAAQAGAIRPEVNLTMLRMIFIGAMNWSIEWFREGAGAIDAFADTVIDVMFNGVAAGLDIRTPEPTA